MEENKNNIKPEGTEGEKPENSKKLDQKEAIEALQKELNERREKSRIANEAISQGKGILNLETPIKEGKEEISQLPFDFTKITGLEYIAAMDSDTTNIQIYRITYRQALSLFATAAAKEVASLDNKDIIERIGVTDAIEAVQLATIFFTASTRAGRLRISKK